MDLESQNSKDARVERLWRKLDTENKGELDINGLRRGMKRINHPLKNADSMLRDVMKALDKNGDGKIQYEEFRVFVEQAEYRLRVLFNSIDRDHNGKLDKGELQAAVKSAGITVPKRELEQFFREVDVDKDGVISFEEWRNFLLFLPTNRPGIKEVWYYHSTAVTMNSEGDTLLSDDTVEGLGFFVAGAVAGAVSRTCTAPLDRLKTYLIASTAKPELALSAAAKGDVSGFIKHLGRPLVSAFQDLWRSGGIRSLYSGNGLNVLKVMPESAIRFGCYEAAKRAVADFEGHGEPKDINGFSKFMAGGVAGVVAQACVYPIDTLKFRMQCETVSHGLRGNALVMHTAQSMYRNGGIATAYRGLTVGLLGMFPYAAIDFGVMEFLKTRYTNRQARKLNLSFPLSEEDCARAQPGPMGFALIGACSGSVGATVVYPVNLLRTRLQAQGTVLHPQVYGSFKDVYVKTIAREGWRGLWKGLTPNLLKVIPAVSISYMTYESTKKFIGL